MRQRFLLPNIAIMFYTDVKAAYHEPLSYDTYQQLKLQKIKMAVIDNGHLQEFIMNDPAVIRIKAPDASWMD